MIKAFSLSVISFLLTAGLVAGAEAQGSFDKSLTVSGPVDLDVKTDSGGIAVTSGSSGTVRVRAILKGQHGWFDSGDVEARIRELERNPPIEQTGNRIRIGYVHDRDLLKGCPCIWKSRRRPTASSAPVPIQAESTRMVFADLPTSTQIREGLRFATSDQKSAPPPIRAVFTSATSPGQYPSVPTQAESK
jgi:hypothetical protein